MTSPQKAKVTEGDFAKNSMSERGDTLKLAASKWAGGLKEVVRGRIVETGQRTEAYVRNHPGRFIAGACCVGLVTGWLLGHARRNKP